MACSSALFKSRQWLMRVRSAFAAAIFFAIISLAILANTQLRFATKSYRPRSSSAQRILTLVGQGRTITPALSQTHYLFFEEISPSIRDNIPARQHIGIEFHRFRRAIFSDQAARSPPFPCRWLLMISGCDLAHQCRNSSTDNTLILLIRYPTKRIPGSRRSVKRRLAA